MVEIYTAIPIGWLSKRLTTRGKVLKRIITTACLKEIKRVPEYELVFLLKPPHRFGLPQGDMVISPVGPGEVATPPIDGRTGKVVGHGTLPKYRETALSKEIAISEVKGRIHDNYLFLTLEVAGDDLAIKHGRELADRFCVLLSVRTGSYFEADFVQAVNTSQRRPVPIETLVSLMRISVYDLGQLAEEIEAASAACSVSDSVLDKASAYFYHALFLDQERQTNIDPLSFHARLLTSEIILNYYKSVVTIIGERGTDKDHQSRYRQFRISSNLYSDVECLNGLRDDYDIAHYTRDWSALEIVKQEIVFARKTAQGVIKAYIEWLCRDKR